MKLLGRQRGIAGSRTRIEGLLTPLPAVGYNTVCRPSYSIPVYSGESFTRTLSAVARDISA